jgi:hypothetical protein
LTNKPWQPCGLRAGVAGAAGPAGPVDAHHILSKGAGRVDIPVNLLPLCRGCHGLTHTGEIARFDLLAVSAARHGVMQDAIEQEVYRVRRLPKGPSVPRKRKAHPRCACGRGPGTRRAGGTLVCAKCVREARAAK